MPQLTETELERINEHMPEDIPNFRILLTPELFKNNLKKYSEPDTHPCTCTRTDVSTFVRSHYSDLI